MKKLPRLYVVATQLVMLFFAFTGRGAAASADQWSELQAAWRGKVVFFMGYPGSGKGTQGKILAERLGISHLSTGELYRSEAQTGSEIGKRFAEYMERGEIIPKELTFDYLRAELAKDKYRNGFILDGYPKNEECLAFIEEALATEGYSVLGAVYFDIARQDVVERLTGRLLCPRCEHNYHRLFIKPRQTGLCDHCGGVLQARDDDTVASIDKRLTVFDANTRPLLAHFTEQGKLIRIDAKQNRDAVTMELVSHLLAQ